MERRIIQVSIIISTVSTQGKCARQIFPHEVEPVSEQNLQKSVSHYCFSLFAATCYDGQCNAPRFQRVRPIRADDASKKAPDCKFIDNKEDCVSALKELNLEFGYVVERKRNPQFFAKGCTWHRFGAYFNDPGASKCIWSSSSRDPKHLPDCICKM